MTESCNCLNDNLLAHENLGENSANKAFIEILGLLIISELGVTNQDLGFLLIPTDEKGAVSLLITAPFIFPLIVIPSSFLFC